MKITKNKVATLSYTLNVDGFEGRVIESIGKEEAVEFIFGTGIMLAAFENALEGMEKGAAFRFQIPAEKAYGRFNPNAVVELPKDIFLRDGVLNDEILFIGNEIPMMDRSGKRMNGIVKEVTETKVLMDFNHPMAGKDLYFTGLVSDVREATSEELNPPAHSCGCGSGHDHDHGHNHGHNHDHGGCGCGSSDSSNDNCCSSEEKGHGGCGCGA